MGTKKRAGGTAGPGDPKSMFDAMLSAVWRASFDQRGRGKALSPPSPSTDLSVTVEGTAMRIASSTWVEEGHLSMSHTLTERVWSKLGWPMFRDCGRTQNSMLAVDQVREDFYEETAPLLVATAREWPERERHALLGMLELADIDGLDALIKQHEIPLAHPGALDRDDTFIDRLFDGRKKASRLTLLNRTAEMMDEPEPLQRLRVVLEAATLVAACHWEDPYTVIRRANPVLVAALEDDMAVVREAAILLLEQMGRYAVNGGAYDAALPLLDQSVEVGPSFALQHLRRWRARLALDEASAASDWAVFSGAISKVAELAPQHGWELARDVMWIDGHIEAAHAAVAQRDGWPTAKVRRERAKKAKPPKATAARRHETRRSRMVEEAENSAARLPDPFVLPLFFETRHVKRSGLEQFRSLLDHVRN